jgi:hypothetical protein
MKYLNFDINLNYGAKIILGFVFAICSFLLIMDTKLCLSLWKNEKRGNFRIAKYYILVISMSLVRFIQFHN